MRAKVAERGQVTIPKALRDSMGIGPGTILEFHEEGGHIVIEKAKNLDAVDEVYGTLGRGRRTDDVIRELRGEP